MDPRAVSKANDRLRVAKKAVEAMAKTENYIDFSDTWYSFLVASKAIYTVFEQGCKTTPQSRQWFGAKGAERRNDELLNYIFEARNDDEHGLENSTDLDPGGLEAGVSEIGYSSEVVDQFGNVFVGNGGAAWKIVNGTQRDAPRLTSLDGKPIMSIYTKPHPILKAVQARGDRTIHPPRNHLGVALIVDGPLNVANLAIIYLTKLVKEAESLARSKP